MKKEQELDLDLKKFIKRVQTNSLTKSEKRRFVMIQDILHYLSDKDIYLCPRIYVPSQLREISYHNIGHPGVNRMFNAVRKAYYWPNLFKNIYTFVKTCIACQTVNLKTIKSPLQDQIIPSYPFSHISCDIVGPMAPTASNTKYMIVFMDELSGYPEIVASPTVNSADVVNAFFEKIFWKYGSPLSKLTDNKKKASVFTSKMFKDVMQELNIKHRRTVIYNQSPG